MREIINNWLYRYFGDEEAFLLGLIILASLLTIWFLGEFLTPFLISIVIAYIFHGPMYVMIKKGLPPLLALSITYLVFVGIIVGMVVFLIPLVLVEVGAAVNDLPAIMNRGEQLIASLLENDSGYLSDEFLSASFSQLSQIAIENGQRLFSYSLGQIPGILTMTVYIALVLILVFFLLKDWVLLGQGIKGFLPIRRGAMRRIWAEMDLQLANYLRGKALEILIVSVASYIIFAIFGLRYSLLLAIVVGFSVLIPFVGAFAVTIPVALVALFQWGLQPTTLYLIMAYIFLQILDGNVLVPLIFSEAVNLHPVFIILAILVFGGIWGIGGVFFAIPLATLIKALILAWPISDSRLAETSD